jgi:hypothetical protein
MTLVKIGRAGQVDEIALKNFTSRFDDQSSSAILS